MIENTKEIMSVQNVSLCYKNRSGLFKSFEHTALSDISFDLLRGETLGILGRNGCGKSSLLRILAGLINPTDGLIVCDPLLKRSLLALGVGFLPELSGRDNAVLSIMLQGASKSFALDSLPGINEFSELGKFFDQPVKSYSAGMRARLGFATALLTKVDILLIDEILGVGDMRFRKKAEESLINKINSQQTVVFVSHSLQQIKKLCDRVIWISDGVIKLEGKADSVVKDYQQEMNQ